MTTLVRLSPLLLAAFLQTATPTEPGFTQLFNGKDFTGWKLANPAAFKIEEGAIVANAQGGPGHAFYDGPFRDHKFRNFELRVDIMTRPNSNGGVFILTEFQEKGWPAKGFEIQVNNTYERDPVKSGSLYHVSDVKEAFAKDNEWFTERIVVKGESIQVWVNDRQTVNWTQPADWAGSKDFAERVMKPGTIGLQAHDPNSTVYYRNIRIRPLD